MNQTPILLFPLIFAIGCSDDGITSTTSPTTSTTTETGGSTTTPSELHAGYISICTDLIQSEQSDSTQIDGSVLNTGLHGDKGSPKDLCSWAAHYVTFTNAKGDARHLGWKIVDGEGTELAITLPVEKGDDIDVRFAQDIVGYTFNLAFSVFDSTGALVMALTGGEALDASDTGTLSVTRADEPYMNGTVPCGWADAYELNFDTESDNLALEIGAQGVFTMGTQKLNALSVNAYTITKSYCSDNDDTPTDWAVWR
jgi:hypothetical protein